MPRQIPFTEITEKLRLFYFKSKRLPSFAELQTLLGYQSKGGISALVTQLIKRGIVEKDRMGKLLPTSRITHGLKLLGSIQAGFPSPAEEELIDTMSLDEFLIQKPQATFLVKVTGDSMIDAGIMPGDLVLVERGRDPKAGDIVVAQIDQAWTMKFYEKEKGKIVLRAANKKYPTLHPQEELIVGGIVIATIRKYH